LSPDFLIEGAYTFDSGLACGTALFARAERPTAVFCANDEMAAGLLQAARRAGLRVPEDLSVIGFDDFQVASQVWPTLTTLRTPTRDIGRLAALKLFALAEERESPEIDEESLVMRLVVRESTGPVPV